MWGSGLRDPGSGVCKYLAPSALLQGCSGTFVCVCVCGQNEKTHSHAVSLEPLSLLYRGEGGGHSLDVSNFT